MQPPETADLVERLEDAQMALGSMASNRFGAPFRVEIVSWLGKLGVISEQVLVCHVNVNIPCMSIPNVCAAVLILVSKHIGR